MTINITKSSNELPPEDEQHEKKTFNLSKQVDATSLPREKVEESKENGSAKHIRRRLAVFGIAATLLGISAYLLLRQQTQDVPTVLIDEPATKASLTQAAQVKEAQSTEPSGSGVPAETSSVNAVDNNATNDDKPNGVIKFNSETAPANKLTNSLEEAAIDVIRGRYGNGIERKNQLGNDYAAIQSRVNEILKSAN